MNCPYFYKKTDEAIGYYEKSVGLWGHYNLWGMYTFDKKDEALARRYLDSFDKEFKARPSRVREEIVAALEIYLWETANRFFNYEKDIASADKYLSMLLRISPKHELGRFHRSLCLLDKAQRNRDDSLFKSALGDFRELAVTAKDARVVGQSKKILADFGTTGDATKKEVAH